MHREQINFCQRVIFRLFPHFHQNENLKILDCGSLDINGNNRYLFKSNYYTGIDVGPGKNVDVVSKIHEFAAPDGEYDVIVSTECLEHDMHYEKSMVNMLRLLKPGGLMLMTCATGQRHEHGTRRTTPHASPLTTQIDSWSDYYQNLSPEDVMKVWNSVSFHHLALEIRDNSDLYFYGIKKY